jgi:beta-galactosidase GanA
MAHVPPIVFGTQYYRPPNPPRADWARDLTRIRETGMNTVKFWACWSWMHRGPGIVDFDELDELMDLADKNELAVVINTILENAPYWLERQAPEARYVAHDGQAIQLTAAINTPGGGWPGLCFDNEVARETAVEYLAALVERYHDHPTLAVWDVWNEPHLEPTWYHRDKLFCYCDASREAFRAWLERKYGGLDELNAAWARRYSDWLEVEPPRVLETYPDLIDWHEFWLENLRSWLEWKAVIVRRVDSEHPVMTHVASSAYLGTLTQNVWDEWLLAGPVDMFGTSSFPRWLMNDDPVVHLFHLEATRAASASRVFWQSELQGGRGRREGFASTPHQDRQRTEAWVWTALAAGAKGVLFWQWRPELLGPESPGYGLCTPSGESTERTAAATDMARVLADFPELSTSRPVPATVGIIVSRKTALLAFASDRSMDLYALALLGAYRAFTDFDVPVHFVHEDEIARVGVPHELDSLYWPMPLLAERRLAEGLRAFVERGGLLVAEAAPAHYTEGGWCAEVIPGHGLTELFGAVELESDIAAESSVSQDDCVIRGQWLRERLKPGTGDVIGHFDDGSPAVIRNESAGIAILIGTFVALAYEETRDPMTGRWIASLGMQHNAPLKGPGGPITRVHDAGDTLLLFASNWCNEPVRLEWSLPTDMSDVVRSTGAGRIAAGRFELDLAPLTTVLTQFEKGGDPVPRAP